MRSSLTGLQLRKALLLLAWSQTLFEMQPVIVNIRFCFQRFAVKKAGHDVSSVVCIDCIGILIDAHNVPSIVYDDCYLVGTAIFLTVSTWPVERYHAGLTLG